MKLSITKILLKTRVIFYSDSPLNVIFRDSGCVLEALTIDSEELKHRDIIIWYIDILVNGRYYYSRHAAYKDNLPFIILENE